MAEIQETKIVNPKPHYLKIILKKRRIPLYTISFSLGDNEYPSDTTLWKMLNGYITMPLDIENTIRDILRLGKRKESNEK